MRLVCKNLPPAQTIIAPPLSVWYRPYQFPCRDNPPGEFPPNKSDFRSINQPFYQFSGWEFTGGIYQGGLSDKPWTFVGALGKIPLFISNLSISNIFWTKYRTKYLIPRMRFQANFLSLSRNFKMISIMNLLSFKSSFFECNKMEKYSKKYYDTVLFK